MAPRKKCPTCGSRHWHKEPSSGLIACSEGHILQNYRNETTEVTEMGPHAMKKRALKAGKKPKDLRSNADPKLYHGARGRYHYFLCQQWIMRSQVATLMKLWDLPSEFELVCRDVWALHLDLLRDPVPAEPYHHTQQQGEADDADNVASLGMHEVKKSTGDWQQPDGGSRDNGPQRTEQEGDGIESDSGSDSDLNERELDQLMKENSDVSSSETDEEENPNSDPTLKARKKKKRGTRSRNWHHIYESPPSTIAILMVACWVLRVPCLYRDFARIIESYQLPYLDPIRLLPQSMVQHLTKHTKHALSPYHTPSTIVMHRIASRLAKKLYSTYSVFIPEANTPSILWRLVQAMGGTPTLYGLTKRVAGILSLPLTLHASLAPGLRKKRDSDPNVHQMDNVPLEVSLMASCIIVLKMVYGLDGTKRLPRDGEDPACAMPRHDAYLRLVRQMEEHDAKETDFVFSSETPMRLEELDEDRVDAYLAFCERALLGTNTEKVTVVDEYFPVAENAQKQDDVVVNAWEQSLPATLIDQDGKGKDAMKPGEGYRIWHARDVLGSLPSEYRLVLGRAARWIGVKDEYLGAVVEKYERRIVRWQTRK